MGSCYLRCLALWERGREDAPLVIDGLIGGFCWIRWNKFLVFRRYQMNYGVFAVIAVENPLMARQKHVVGGHIECDAHID